MRLDKILAHLGYGSRKDVKKIIRAGHVLVNGEILRDDDAHVDPDNDEIIVGDDTLEYAEKVYWLMNKPQDVVSATVDLRNPTVIDLLPANAGHGLFPIGRLDLDTEGLLVVSNDGALAHRLLSPKKHVDKEYEVDLAKDWDPRYEMDLSTGILIQDPEYQCKPASVVVIDPKKIRIVISEGKYHQVKRMMAACDNEVLRLRRIRMGGLTLDPHLQPGEFRPLTSLELEQIQKTHG